MKKDIKEMVMGMDEHEFYELEKVVKERSKKETIKRFGKEYVAEHHEFDGAFEKFKENMYKNLAGWDWDDIGSLEQFFIDAFMAGYAVCFD